MSAVVSKKPILGYWSVRGIGMSLRQMLCYSLGRGNWEEELYTQVFDDKAEGYSRWNGDSWWNIVDQKQKEGMEFPNLPYLIDREAGVQITQSSAIARYICTLNPELKLAGATPQQVGTAAMIEMNLVDFNSAIDSICFSEDGTKEKLIETTKEYLTPIHKFLGEKKSFLCGDNVTFVDFILFEWTDKCNAEWFFNGKFFDEFPNFKSYAARMEALPILKSEERKQFGLFNGWRAKIGGDAERYPLYRAGFKNEKCEGYK